MPSTDDWVQRTARWSLAAQVVLGIVGISAFATPRYTTEASSSASSFSTLPFRWWIPLRGLREDRRRACKPVPGLVRHHSYDVVSAIVFFATFGTGP